MTQQPPSKRPEPAHRIFDSVIVGRTTSEILDFVSSVLESSTEYSIIGKDLDGTVVLWNEGARRIYGYEPEEIIGLSSDLLHADVDLVEGLPALMREEALRQGRWEGVVSRVRKNGQTFQARVVMTPRGDALGQPVGFLLISKDMTVELQVQHTLEVARLALEDRLEMERMGRAKDAFLATVSHELRTPLNAIIGYVGTLLMGLPGPLNEEQVRQLGVVRESAHHLLSLIDDILDVSRATAGKVDFKLEALDLREIVEEVAVSLRPSADAKRLTIDLDLPGDLGLRADRRAIKQILLNLVDNAIKFTDAGGVNVQARRTPVGVTIRVADTGIGIARDRIKDLFEPFVRVGQREHMRPGTGLGLFLSRRLAESMNGSLEVESSEGRGTTLTLELSR